MNFEGLKRIFVLVRCSSTEFFENSHQKNGANVRVAQKFSIPSIIVLFLRKTKAKIMGV